MANEEGPPSVENGLLARIRGISIANYIIGTGEAVAGLLIGNATLTTAAIHDVSDGLLYSVKHSAAKEKDPVKKIKKRRIGAWSLVGVAGALGGAEIIHSLAENVQASPVAVGVAAVALVANGVAALVMHDRRHKADARDTWRHVAQADLPGALVTLGATTAMAATGNPMFDTAGAIINTGLAINVGLRTLRETGGSLHPVNDYMLDFGLRDPLGGVEERLPPCQRCQHGDDMC
jgi:divalent metal cation (Fe/Co/Zn/Cd) transporter